MVQDAALAHIVLLHLHLTNATFHLQHKLVGELEERLERLQPIQWRRLQLHIYVCS